MPRPVNPPAFRSRPFGALGVFAPVPQDAATSTVIPYGPSHWEMKQWIGFAVYVTLFLLFTWLVYRFARPSEPSELPPDES